MVDPTTGQYPVPADDGERVRYTVRNGPGEGTGEGVFMFCWLGIEEAWKVQTDDGLTLDLYPCFGDTMEPRYG